VTAQVTCLVAEREYPTSSIVFYEGDRAEELFILASGKIELTYTLPNNSCVTLPITKVLPGEVFGWSALAGGQNLTAQAKTLEDSSVYAIPALPLRRILSDNPAAGFEVMTRLVELVSRRLRDTRLQLRWLQSNF
jgi:CRP-like cAMP-binding protein